MAPQCNLWCINYSPIFIYLEAPGDNTGMSKDHATTDTQINSPRQVLFASLIGTAIEFFDFYIYATAAVLVFPRLFFPASDTTAATFASFATAPTR